MSIPFSTQQFQIKPNAKIRTATVRLDKIDATQFYLQRNKAKHVAEDRGDGPRPLPLVHRFNGRYKVTDGHNRIGHAMDKGETHMKVKIAP